MANFEVFQCNVCNRKTEKPVDQTHATLTKCTITYKCVGTLIKISQSDTKTMSGASYDANLVNWTPRGQAAPKPAQVQNPQISVNAGNELLTFAINNSLVSSVTSIDAVFEVKKATNTSIVEYFYNRSYNTSLVSGQDDSAKKLTLRFSNTSPADSVIVYVNGVVKDPSTYDRNTEGRIVFNPILTGEVNQIKILVYKQAEPTFTTLTFIKNSTANANTTNSWGNISKVSMPVNINHAVFTCSNVSSLLINSQLILDHVKPTNTNTNFTGEFGYILLDNPPYSTFDRNLANAISLNYMISNNEIIQYKDNIKGEPTFFVDGNTSTSIFPPISIITKMIDDVDLKLKNDTDTSLSNLYIT